MLFLLAACLVNQSLYDQRLDELLDQDGDGYVADSYPEYGGSDCDDSNPDVNPGEDEEPYDLVDNDCDDSTPDDDLDADGFTRESDCDDNNASIHPGADEICDGVDNDCDGADSCLPEGVVDLTNAPLQLRMGGEEDSATGAMLASVDYDGDGLEDAIIGSPLANGQAGRIDVVPKLYSLTPGSHDISDIAGLTIHGDGGPGLLGLELAPGCDTDGDGFEDLVVAANGDRNGAVYVFEGGPIGSQGSMGLNDAGRVYQAEEPDAAFGSGISCMHLDDDTDAELIIGQFLSDAVRVGGGRVWVFEGGAEGNSTADASVVVDLGTADASGLGRAVGPLGDLNGDGLEELGIASTACASDGGCVWIADTISVLLNTETQTVVTTDDLSGPVIGTMGEGLGSTLAEAGDLDGDGIPDLLLAGRNDDLGTYAAWFFSDFSNRSTWARTSETAAARWMLEYPGEQLTRECSAGSDVDGDGIDDVIVSEQVSSLGAPNGGAALLFLGGNEMQGTLDASDAWSALTSSESGARAGASVQLASDMSGDGLGDIMVGVPLLGGPGGYVAVWWGGPRQ